MSKIIEYLSAGQENAIPLSDLAAAVNIPERSLQKEILTARLSGELILSSDRGYFLPSDPDDLREYVIKRKAYIKTASKALRPFLNALKGCDQA